MMNQDTRTCRRCGEEKPTDRFRGNPHRGGRPFSICKSCEATAALARYIEKQKAAGEAYTPRLVETAPEGHRTCRMCGKAYPHTREFFTQIHLQKGMYGTCKPCAAAKAKKERQHLRLEVIAYYSRGAMKCACCSEQHLEFLTIDHVGGGGNKHRREIGKSGLYPWLKRHGFPEGFRVLCFNCNWAESHGGCPHNRERSIVVGMKKEA